VASDELAFRSLAHVRQLLAAKEVSSQELVESQLRRLDSVEPELNAFITVTAEDALRDAKARDQAAARGQNMGPLHGVPLTLKDLLWTRGVRTTSGSKIFTDFVPAEDSTAVARLRGAGAVFLGKTNLHEFAYGVSSVNPHYGPVHNPWDLERISGGSSGGSAAALTAGVGYGSIGTDTGGSIRIPSALCGTVGLKPTYGRVSRFGVTPLAWSLDHVGPMARGVEDAAILFDVLAGHDGKDPSTVRGTVEPASEGLEVMPAGLRMGIEESHLLKGLDAEVANVFQTAVRDLMDLGLERIDVDIPELEQVSTCRNVIAFAEASSYHERTLRERPGDYGESVRELLQMGLFIRASEYLTAQRARRRLVQVFRDVFENIDLLACPTVAAPAPKIGEEKLSNGEELRSGLLRLASPFNTVGFPAISLTAGFTRSGLPLGLQIVARPFDEALLLKVAHAYECSHAWSREHPRF
jgi:aspartyl-tRNA(Asn)/glutamyl-tRNA(Gln) amidotransferase subunit A